jgi:hypothetical protein
VGAARPVRNFKSNSGAGIAIFADASYFSEVGAKRRREGSRASGKGHWS